MREGQKVHPSHPWDGDPRKEYRLECSKGAVCPNDAMGAPQWCTPGSYMDFNSSGSPACLNTPLGQYQDEARATTYKACQAGRFSIVVGSTACEFCDAGGYCEEPGASSASVFKLCPPGTWSDIVGANSNAFCFTIFGTKACIVHTTPSTLTP